MKSWLLGMMMSMASAIAVAATPYTLSYSGRLTDAAGKPPTGLAELEVSFFSVATGGTATFGPLAFPGVMLSQGVFQLELALDPHEFHNVFGGATTTFIEVKDLTANRVYPRQRFSAVPYALKVPIDGQSLAYDTDGKLGLAKQAANSGDFLKFDGTHWLPGNVAGPLGGTVTSVAAGAGLTTGGVAITGAGTMSIDAGGVTDSMLAGSIAQSKITNLTTDLGTLTTAVTGKAPTSHTHAEADVTGLVADLAGKAATAHSHAEADVTGLVADLASKAATTHTHSALDASDGSPANALVVDAAGNVGIGTTNPTATLDVEGSVTIGADTSSTAALAVKNTGSGDTVVFRNNIGNPDFTLTNAGNIGIGTTTPETSLHLFKDGGESKVTLDTFNDAGHSHIIGRRARNNAGAPAVTTDGNTLIGLFGQSWDSNSWEPSADIILQSSGTASDGNSPGKILLRTTPAGTNAPQTRLSILANGNVGIGTSNPTAKLHIGGVAGTDGLKFPDGTLQTTASSPGISVCPSGFTMIGTAGRRGTYCIDTTERSGATFLGAKKVCHDLSLTEGAAYMCNHNQWYKACDGATVSDMTDNNEWTADLRGTSYAVAAGNGGCTTLAETTVITSLTYRCCVE